MLTQIRRRRTILIVVLSIIGPIMILTLAGPGEGPDPGDKQTYLDKSGDEELAYLLVKLEKKTRQVIAGHYGRRQSGEPEATATYKKTLIENRILPAAVADPIFSEVVPGATGGRAWVRMVVPEPRNPNNRGDSTALAMLAELQKGAESVWQTTRSRPRRVACPVTESRRERQIRISHSMRRTVGRQARLSEPWSPESHPRSDRGRGVAVLTEIQKTKSDRGETFFRVRIDVSYVCFRSGGSRKIRLNK
jgi:hypothetical protein